MSRITSYNVCYTKLLRREYVRHALLGNMMGHKVYIVVEKTSELELVLSEAAQLGVEPCIGVRARLASQGSGKWQASGGEKSKFGLSAAQILRMVERLRQEDKLGCLQLVHFHLGSRITSYNVCYTKLLR